MCEYCDMVHIKTSLYGKKELPHDSDYLDYDMETYIIYAPGIGYSIQVLTEGMITDIPIKFCPECGKDLYD